MHSSAAPALPPPPASSPPAFTAGAAVTSLPAIPAGVAATSPPPIPAGAAATSPLETSNPTPTTPLPAAPLAPTTPPPTAPSTVPCSPTPLLPPTTSQSAPAQPAPAPAEGQLPGSPAGPTATPLSTESPSTNPPLTICVPPTCPKRPLALMSTTPHSKFLQDIKDERRARRERQGTLSQRDNGNLSESSSSSSLTSADTHGSEEDDPTEEEDDVAEVEGVDVGPAPPTKKAAATRQKQPLGEGTTTGPRPGPGRGFKKSKLDAESFKQDEGSVILTPACSRCRRQGWEPYCQRVDMKKGACNICRFRKTPCSWSRTPSNADGMPANIGPPSKKRPRQDNSSSTGDDSKKTVGAKQAKGQVGKGSRNTDKNVQQNISSPAKPKHTGKAAGQAKEQAQEIPDVKGKGKAVAKGKGKAVTTVEPPAKRPRRKAAKVYKSAEFVQDSEEEWLATEAAIKASRNESTRFSHLAETPEAGPSGLPNPSPPSNHSGPSGGTAGTGVSAADVARAQDSVEHALVGWESHSRIVDELRLRLEHNEQEMQENRESMAAMRAEMEKMQRELAELRKPSPDQSKK
ncbi:hypothetical protein DENSPDRAFT_885807 [Dentipellis sp. KUC8613]|nr:hypothetical protein DENSPDRAFT_885807 [Dentipellis sp. KUC8613]